MTNIFPWLPDEALKPAVLERTIAQIVGDWSSHWFSRTRASCRTKLREISSGGPAGLDWRSWGGECGICIDEGARFAVVEAMLDRSIVANAVQAADRPLINDMAERCLDDLLGRLSWIIDHDRGPDMSSEPLELGRGMVWDIGLRKSGTSFSLVVHRSTLVRWRKTLAPKATTPALARVASALNSQSVRLDLYVGRGSLTIGELEELAIGDVVILSSAVDSPLALMAAGRRTGISGSLKQDGQSARVDIIERRKVAT